MSRRSALSTLGAAGAGLLFSRAIRGQDSPIVIGGREVEIAVTLLGPSTVRFTLNPVLDGTVVPVPDDGALVGAASTGTTTRRREREMFGKLTAGELSVRFTEEPPTLHVESAAGRIVQRLTLDEAGHDVSFLLPGGPLLGMGEGGPQFDRRGPVDEMRNGQRGYRLHTHGGRVPIQGLVGTDGWGMYFHQPPGTFDFTGTEGRMLVEASADVAPLDVFVTASDEPSNCSQHWDSLMLPANRIGRCSMAGSTTFTRREWIGAMGAAAALASSTRVGSTAEADEPMSGVFKILATPYKQDRSVDYEDLAAEVEFLVRCGVQGLVWPQNSSDLPYLTEEEILEGMEVVARAAKGTSPALVLGVQGRNTEAMLRLARHAERLSPDAMIAMPPKDAETLDEYREYYGELCRVTSSPVFIQTSAGAPDLEPSVDFIVELGKKFPNFGYVKEEYGETIPRMIELSKHRPGPVKRVFGGSRALGWTYEMRLGMDGMMTGGPQYAEVYTRIWKLHLENRPDAVRDLYAKLLLITNLESHVPGLRPYLMERRGVFKTHVTRRGDFEFGPVAIAEIDYNLEPLKPYLHA